MQRRGRTGTERSKTHKTETRTGLALAMGWDDYRQVAEALARQYPGTDRLNLETEDAVTMITGLPGFRGPSVPPDEEAVEDIITAWLQLDGESPESGEQTA